MAERTLVDDAWLVAITQGDLNNATHKDAFAVGYRAGYDALLEEAAALARALWEIGTDTELTALKAGDTARGALANLSPALKAKVEAGDKAKEDSMILGAER